MKTHLQLSKWIVDAGLLAGFLIAFFLDLTGVVLHQWLGVALAVFAGYHLGTHWNWVKAVTARLLGQTSAQARLYYLVDAGVLLGFGLISFTGLVISTWLDLALDNYALWRDAHVLASLATLGLVVFKIGLHWRWIVYTTQQLLWSAGLQPAPRLARPLTPAAINRRHFLTLMSIVGVAGWVAARSALAEEDSVQAAALPASAAPSASAAAQTAATTAKTTTTTTCTVRCNKRCPYPGRCRRYVDRNNNQRCDLGECA